MKSITSRGVFLLLLLVDGHALIAQEHTEIVDLAMEVQEEPVERTVPANTPIVLHLKNQIPRVGYAFSKRLETISIPTLPLDGRGFPGVLIVPDKSCSKETTAEYDQKIKSLKSEKEVPGLTADLERSIEQNPNCVFELWGLITDTKSKHEIPAIRRGERLVVTLTRPSDDEVGRDIRTWTIILSPGSRGSWEVSYGLAFVADFFSETDHFTAELLDDAMLATAQDESSEMTGPEGGENMFVITRGRREDRFSAIPSAFFSWHPTEHDLRNWNHSFRAGLGLDKEKPVVFVGWGATYNANIMFSAGVAWHKQQKLAPEFREGQKLLTKLESDRLHEEFYRVNPYIAVTYRFEGNPFDGSDAEAQSEKVADPQSSE